MGNRPVSYQDVALQIFYASIFYPFANFRQLANRVIFCLDGAAECSPSSANNSRDRAAVRWSRLLATAATKCTIELSHISHEI